ncbi:MULTISPECIES: PHP domain-containing protein [Clostridium]|jgi:predicted metal-dependent phosphoesterase TrpH|uniref:PHP domain-containing protein n=1 Tax=Clostridium TaxID=1485 RepID=UPI00028858BF|nr:MULTISPECIES: PHP domain-containing protein [Clostridium]MDF2503518.1 putative metal-dependent phosphoesterase, family [Clostridium sp.]
MKADLHNHSFLSDGVLSVQDIIGYSKKVGLNCIAITDHDTMAGVLPAYTFGEKIGMSIIPGVEISTVNYETNRSVHMLCYFPKDIFKLQGFLNKILINRENAKRQMAKMLMSECPITMEHIERYSCKSQSMYETHIMQAVADLGYTNVVIGKLYKELLSKKGKYYVQITYPSVYEALEMIKEVGGIAVMAHPGQFDSIELLEELARKGLVQGAEYNHPRNSEEVKKQIKDIAERYNLIMTGGTDFHGYYSNSPHPIGSFTCPEGEVEKLITLGHKAYENK